MSEARVDGFCLLNVDVPLPTANPAVALLTACLDTLSTWIDFMSQFLSSSNTSGANLCGRAVAIAVGERKRLFDWAERPSVAPKTSSQHASEQRWTLDDTDAQVIIPEARWDARNPGSYVMVLDLELQSGECPIINVAANTDHEFIKALLLYENLKSRTLTGALRKLFSVHMSTLEFVVVKRSETGELLYSKNDFDQLYAKSRDRWMYPDESIYRQFPYASEVVFNYLYTNSRLVDASFWKEHESQALQNIPRRRFPLTNSELHNEMIDGPIPALMFKKQVNIFRLTTVMLLYFFVIITVRFGINMSRLTQPDIPVLIIAAFYVLMLLFAFMFPLTGSEGRRQTDVFIYQVTSQERFSRLAGAVLGLGLQFFTLATILFIFAILFDVLVLQRHRRSQSHGIYRATLRCHCGKRIVTERPMTVVDRSMVETLYSFGTHLQTTGPFSPTSMINYAKPTFVDKNLSLPVHQDRSAVDDTSQDIVQDPVGLSSSLSTLGPEPGAATQRRREINLSGHTQKFLYSCYPSKSDRILDQVTVSSANESPTDKELIEGIKEQYFSSRSHITLLKSLRGFSAIRLARFEYYRLSKLRNSAIPIQWKWPEPENTEWETSRSPTDPLSEESGLSQYMLHIWTDGCSNDSPVKPKQKQKERWLSYLILKYSNTSYSLPMNTGDSPPPFGLSTWPRSFTLFLEGIKAPKNAKEKEPTTQKSRNLDWTCISLEVDYDDRLADARAIYHRTPKKLRTRLKPDPTGASPPIAWAIWIDEDFVVPWYLPLSLLIASIGNVIFAAWYTAESGTVKANGWTIGGGILTAVVTAFNGWVLWAKDSKHPRM